MKAARLFYIALVELEVPGGPAVHTLNLVKGMRRIGAEVTLFCPRPGKKIEDLPDAKYIFIPFYGFTPLRIFLFTLFAFMQLIKEGIRKRPDFLYAREIDSDLLMPLAAKILGVPYFIDVNGPLPADYQLGKAPGDRDESGEEVRITSAQKILAGWRSLWRRFQLKTCKGMTFNTAQWRDQLFSEFNVPAEKSEIVTMHVDIESFKPMDRAQCQARFKLDPAKTWIGYVGTFQPVHEFELLFEALGLLLSQGHKCGLVLAGKGNDFDYWKERAAKLPYASSIIFSGWIKHSEIPYYINSFHAAAALLKPHKAYAAESLLKVKEYLACGVPVIVSKCNPEAFKGYLGGIAMADYDADDLAEKILQTISLPSRETLFPAVEYVRKHFHLDAAAGQTLEWMEHLSDWRRNAR